MATDLMRSGAVNAPELTGVSLVWRDSLDEPFIREVESHCGIDGVRISTHEVPIISETQAGNATPDSFQALRTSIAATAGRLGARTILTGQGGDLMLGNWFDDSLQVAASVRSLRPGKAFKEALAWSKILRRPIHQILSQAIQAALPSAWSPAGVYATVDGSYTPKSDETSLITRFTELNETDRFFSNAWMQAPPERRKYFRALSMMLELRQLQPAEPLQHLDYTHPFAHRPLVEFLMSVPTDVLCRPGEPRRLMRATFSDLWPRKLRERRSKGLFNTPWQEALRPLAHTLLKDTQLHVVERGIVDRRSVRARLERVCVGLDCNESQLRQIILLELWLRNRESRLSAQIRRAA